MPVDHQGANLCPIYCIQFVIIHVPCKVSLLLLSVLNVERCVSATGIKSPTQVSEEKEQDVVVTIEQSLSADDEKTNVSVFIVVDDCFKAPNNFNAESLDGF